MTRSRTTVVTAARMAAIAARLAAITKATCRSADGVCTGCNPSDSRHAGTKLDKLFLSDDALVDKKLVRGLRLKSVRSAKKQTYCTE